jgi:hemoglobin
VVEDFFRTVSKDPRVDESRGGKFKLDDEGKVALKRKLVEFISSVTGGPLKYKGRSMKKAHKGMAITNAEFDASGVHFKKALEKNGAAAADVALVMKLFESTRKDIVEVDKKIDKKIDTKKVPAGKAAKVSGKVTIGGEPLGPPWHVTLLAPDNRSFSTYIQANGRYSFRTPIPVGKYRVVIEPVPQEPGQPKADLGRVPQRYRDAATSGLTVDVPEGETNLDIKIQSSQPKKR